MDQAILSHFDYFFKNVFPFLPDSQYGNLESAYLYGVLRSHKFKNIVELGTEKHSRSSYIIQLAKGKAKHHMFDLPEVIKEAVSNLEIEMGTNGVIPHPGKFENTYQEIDWSKIDFLFIDADHKRDFAVFYLQNVIPKLKPGTLVHVHDMNLWGNWQTGYYPDSEIEEFVDRFDKGYLPLVKVEWLWDYCINPNLEPFTNLLSEKYPAVGFFPMKELPYGCSATYWRTL